MVWPPRHRVIRSRRDVACRSAMGLAIVTLLSACGGDSYMGARAFSVQGKFDWQDCKQLAVQQTSFTKRIADLNELMAKASRDAGGGFVNATVHQPTLVGLEADRRLIDETMVEKHCDAPVAAAPAATTTAKKR